ncbi:hypothetical protein CEE36_05495 [candidate division TA06 bacterium B3_TA06]|uniref:Uncharacterized protein n=1 Tax=candidate division TA06 bacterium B3_TA06 TaxID=2012487 RepID=A0A532V722_UNCT6|nr:MAG: hypothetical protein CEE36_05495 [candidate division TA06 bacterium B3_TA06]
MDTAYVQNLRYKLQKRFRRVNSADLKLIHVALKQFWSFLHSYPVFVGILKDLKSRVSDLDIVAVNIENGSVSNYFPDNELQAAGISFYVISKCLKSSREDSEYLIGAHYGETSDAFEALNKFRVFFVEPLYEYLDEQLDDQRAILALLRRYKHKCEWFQRNELHKMWEDDRSRGEKKLALNLYEYLHDQGLDFNIEPWSISGEADLVAAQKSDEPLIADVKVFSEPNKKNYIINGFGQIYRYTRTFNEPFGYLIIFNTSDADLKLALLHQEQATPFVVSNGKTIFMLTIDIYPVIKTASKEGKLKTVEITEKDLVKVVEEEQLKS